jgi:excisionase family DNA binding protein
MSDCLTLKECAARLHLSYMTVWNMVYRGELPAVRIAGRSLRVMEQNLIAYLESRAI